ncbi:TPA: type II toxin-antitoxin system RelE/ParE family toxin, partial [Escherichia coli]
QGMRVTHFRHRTIIAFAVDSRKVFIVGIYHGGQSYETDFL